MDATIICGLISGGTAIIVCVIGQIATYKQTKNLLEYRLTQLEKKVDKHNNLIERMAKAEIKIADLEDRMEDLKND